MLLPTEIGPREVKQRLDAGGKLHWIDVREPWEFAIARIPWINGGGDLIPMRMIPGALQQLIGRAEEAPLMVYCHHGVRSLDVVHWLREHGIENCQSIAGGIDAWSLIADSSVPRY